jgi:hypothetical protein
VFDGILLLKNAGPGSYTWVFDTLLRWVFKALWSLDVKDVRVVDSSGKISQKECLSEHVHEVILLHGIVLFIKLNSSVVGKPHIEM